MYELVRALWAYQKTETELIQKHYLDSWFYEHLFFPGRIKERELRWNRATRTEYFLFELMLKYRDEEESTVPQSKIKEKKSGILAIWHVGQLFLVDLEQKTVEPYDPKVHGARSSTLELQGNQAKP